LGGIERERERGRMGGWLGVWLGGKRLWAKTRIEKGNKRVREWEEKSSRSVENVKTRIQRELENGKKSSRRVGNEFTM